MQEILPESLKQRTRELFGQPVVATDELRKPFAADLQNAGLIIVGALNQAGKLLDELAQASEILHHGLPKCRR